MSSKMFYVLSTLIAFVLCFAVFVRLNPLDAARLHQQPQELGAQPGGFGTVVAGATLEDLAQIVAATPRTRPLAGSLAQGHVSFVTRSALWGFPDVTNLWQTPQGVALHSHLVYGKSDLGVNRKRIDGWLAQRAGDN